MWFCCQLGAREHYAIPRALHRCGRLACLVTDAWNAAGMDSKPSANGRPQCWFVPPVQKARFASRFHTDLARARILHNNWRSFLFEAWATARQVHGWKRIIARNEWFQKGAVNSLQRFSRGESCCGPVRPSPDDGNVPSTPVVFAYSYAAKEIFRYAKSQGWRTVLGQIDPGPAEEQLVARLHRGNLSCSEKTSGITASWIPAPHEYWAHWRQECQLADRIIVNSTWSSEALLETGIDSEKIRLLPLAYEPSAAQGQKRNYPERFNSERPMRVLFLGQINLRKGLGPLLEAVHLLFSSRRPSPIEFWFVGKTQVEVPEALKADPRIRWFGPVPRSVVPLFYRSADLFILPTFSDGFGLTQLEAQAWKLPVVCSKKCGEVVIDGLNGWLLPEVTAAAIAARLNDLAAHPETLTAAARNSSVPERSRLINVGQSLVGLWPDE